MPAPVTVVESRYYRISGLRVQSDISLYGSIEDSGSEPADLYIRLGSVPAALDGAVLIGPNWQSAPPSFLVEVPGVVRFLVTSGTDIVVEPVAGVALDDAAIFIIGTATAIALYQRGALLLHASAVASNGNVFAFSGASGAGKSTLAALLCLHGGCEIVSDDVSALDLGGAFPVLQADGRRFRLWEDVIDWMDVADHRRKAVRSQIHKFHVELPAQRAETVLPLRGIYLLESLPERADPIIELLSPGKAAVMLDHQRYRRLLANQINDVSQRFALMAELVDRVPVYVFRRSVAVADNARSVACLKAHWESLV